MNQKQDALKYSQKGHSADRGKKFEVAVVYYSRAIKSNKDKSRYHFGMAQAFAEQGKYQKACFHWKRVVLLDPKDAAAYYNFGYALDTLGKFKESIEMYKESIRLDPNDADTHENLAIVLSSKGNYEEAHGYYLRALRLKPKNAFKIANGIGCLYFLQGMFVKASEEFQKSINLKERFVDAYWNMSVIYFCEGKLDEAEKYFEEGMKIIEEEESKIDIIKESIASYRESKARFEAKLNHANNEILNEGQIKLFRIMVDGLAKIEDLLAQRFDE